MSRSKVFNTATAACCWLGGDEGRVVRSVRGDTLYRFGAGAFSSGFWPKNLLFADAPFTAVQDELGPIPPEPKKEDRGPIYAALNDVFFNFNVKAETVEAAIREEIKAQIRAAGREG